MEIVGRAPELAGLLCEAFICQGFVNKATAYQMLTSFTSVLSVYGTD